jgi:hypothetical protein
LALRFALNAPPCGLRRAALRAKPTATKILRKKPNKAEQDRKIKGDISNEVRKGTFLKSFDKVFTSALTAYDSQPKMNAT